MVEQNSGVTLGRLAGILRHNWITVIALGIIGGVVAFGASAAQTPVYQATASTYFSLRQGATSTDLNQGSTYTQNQMLSFARLATSSLTLDRVIDDLRLQISTKDLARNIDVANPENTVVLDITVSSPSATRAAAIANSVASNLAAVVGELAPATQNEDAAVSARVIEPAVAPNEQSSPNKSRNALLGGILGLLVGAIGSVIFALLDNRVRSVEALASASDIPLLGQLPRFQKSGDARELMVQNPNGGDAEAFRRLRSSLRFASVDRDVRLIAVTSGQPAEGKSTLAVNLALAVAETGTRVLLVDADLRRPRVAQRLGVDGTVGLTSVLVGAVTIDEARRPFGTTSLDLLTSGDLPPNPSELLSSARMAQILTELAAKYDLVIVDTAPVLSVADATLLAPHADLTLLVVDSSKTRKAQLLRSIRSLELAGAHVAGIVLNKVTISKRRDAYYYDLPAPIEPGLTSRLRSRIGSSLHAANPDGSTAAVPPRSTPAVAAVPAPDPGTATPAPASPKTPPARATTGKSPATSPTRAKTPASGTPRKAPATRKPRSSSTQAPQQGEGGSE